MKWDLVGGEKTRGQDMRSEGVFFRKYGGAVRQSTSAAVTESPLLCSVTV